MTQWETQEMEEDARAKAWEDYWDSKDEEMCGHLIEAAHYVSKAADSLADAVADMEAAAGELEDTPMYDRVVALIDQMEDILSNIRYMRDKFSKGERV